MLHLDSTEVQDELPNNPRVPVSPTGAPVYSSSSSTYRESDSRTQDEQVRETFKWSSASEDFPFLKQGDGTELEPLDLLHPLQTAAVTESTGTQTPAVARRTGHTLNLHRKYRSLLRKRQTSGSSGKSRRHTHFSQMFCKVFLQHDVLTVNCCSGEHLSLVL